jgi:SPP1 gp7 family putative phage head morphogenesis protein
MRSVTKAVSRVASGPEAYDRLQILAIQAPHVVLVKTRELATRAKADVRAANSRQAALLGLPALGDVGGEDFVDRNSELMEKTTKRYVSQVAGVLGLGLFVVGDVAEDLARRALVAENHAALIGVDQVLKLNSELLQDLYVANGENSYVWTTMKDDRVRPSHADLEGGTFSWDAPPLEGTLHPGEDFNCRCIAVPVISPQ